MARRFILERGNLHIHSGELPFGIYKMSLYSIFDLFNASINTCHISIYGINRTRHFLQTYMDRSKGFCGYLSHSFVSITLLVPFESQTKFTILTFVEEVAHLFQIPLITEFFKDKVLEGIFSTLCHCCSTHILNPVFDLLK